MPRAKRVARASASTPAAEERPAVEPQGDTTVANSNFEEHEDGDRAPMNYRVRLKQVCAFKLETVVKNAAGDMQYDRLEHEQINEKMTEREVAALCGPGTYRATWFKLSKALKGERGRVVYQIHEFTTRSPANAVAPPPASAAAVVTPHHPRGDALASDERLVPYMHDTWSQWMYVQMDTARADRTQIMGTMERLVTVLESVSAKNAEMATQNSALAASMVTAMHAASSKDLELRTRMAGEVIDMRMAMANNGGIEKMVAQFAQRLGDRFLPADGSPGVVGAGAKMSATLDKVDKTMPKLDGMANELPAIKAQLAELGAFIREARPALRQLSAMTGGEPAAADAPAAAVAAEPAAADPTNVDV